MNAIINDHEVTVRRVVDALPERVWKAWTTPEQFAYWFSTPPFRTPVETVALDVRPGGTWRATQVGDDGTELPFAGRYLVTDAPTRLVFTLEDPEHPDEATRETVTVNLVELIDGRTQMNLLQEGHLPQEQYPLLGEGYNRFIDRLEALLTGKAGV